MEVEVGFGMVPHGVRENLEQGEKGVRWRPETWSGYQLPPQGRFWPGTLRGVRILHLSLHF